MSTKRVPNNAPLREKKKEKKKDTKPGLVLVPWLLSGKSVHYPLSLLSDQLSEKFQIVTNVHMKLQFQEEHHTGRKFTSSSALVPVTEIMATRKLKWLAGCHGESSTFKLKKLRTTVLCSHAETIRTCINSPFNNLSILLVDAFP